MRSICDIRVPFFSGIRKPHPAPAAESLNLMIAKNLLAPLLLLGWMLAAGWSAALGAAAGALPRPRLVLVGALPGDARHLARQGDRIYIAGQGAGPADAHRLTIASASDPNALRVLGVYETPRPLEAVAVAEAHAYLANGYQGLIILDISEPARITEVGRTQEVAYAADVAVAGTLAYVLEGDGALRVFDVSNPGQPRQLGVSGVEEYEGRAVAVADGYAYIASGGRGVRVVDVSDPTRPVTAGYYDPPGPYHARDVVAAGQVLFLADKSILDLTGSVRALDISNPRAPLEIGAHPVDEPALGVAYDQGFVFLAHETGGVSVFDASDPTALRFVAAYNTPGQAVDVWANDGSVLVADGEGGLLLFHFLQPAIFLPSVQPAPRALDAGGRSLIQ